MLFGRNFAQNVLKIGHVAVSFEDDRTVLFPGDMISKRYPIVSALYFYLLSAVCIFYSISSRCFISPQVFDECPKIGFG